MAAMKRAVIEYKAHFDSGYSLIHYPIGVVASVGAGVAGLKAYGVLLPVWMLPVFIFVLLVGCVSIGYLWNNRGWFEEQQEFSNRRNPAIKKLLRGVWRG